MNVRPSVRAIAVVGVAAAVVVLLVLPSLINPYRLFLASLIASYATAGFGLTVIMGWTGQIVLAHGAFFGVGAYLSAHLHGLGVPWPLAALGAAGAAAVGGAVIGFPAVRLRGFYLAIATLALAELARLGFVEAETVTGGITGRSVEPFHVGGLDLPASNWYLALTVAAGVLTVVWRVRATSLGRCLLAVRDAETAAASFGIAAARYKLVAFGLSAAIAALAGAVFGQLQAYLTPEIFGVGLLIQFLVVSFVGGVTYLAGPLVGAGFVVVARELLQDAGAAQRLIYAVALIAVVRFIPGGLAGIPAMVRRGSAAGWRRHTPVAVTTTPEAAA